MISSVTDCLEHLASMNTADGVDLQWPLQLFIGNIITRILFNFSFKYDDCQPLKDFANLGEQEMDNMKYHISTIQSICIRNTHPIIMLLAQNFPSVLKLPFVGNFLVGHHYKIVDKVRNNIAKILYFLEQ